MPLNLKGRAKSCLAIAIFNATIGIGSLYAQEADRPWYAIWEENGFQYSEDEEELIGFFKDGEKFVSNNYTLNDFVEAVGLEGVSKINFGYEIGSSNGVVPVLSLEKKEFNPALSLTVRNRTDSTIESSIISLKGEVSFTNKVFVELISKYSEKPVITTASDSAINFLSSLTMTQSGYAGCDFLNISSGSSVTTSAVSSFIDNTEIGGSSGVVLTATSSKFNVNDSLIIKADNVFKGSGEVVVNFKQGETDKSSPQKYVVVDGSFKDFTGNYSQKGGILYLQGELNTDLEGKIKNWTFEDVDIFTSTSNLYKIAEKDWDGTQIQEEKFVTSSGSFNSISLTDAYVSLDYLLEAQKLYNTSPVIVLGEVYVKDTVISEVSFNELELLNKNTDLILTHVSLNLGSSGVVQDKKVKIGGLSLDQTGSVELKNSDFTLYGNIGNVTNNISEVSLTGNSKLLVHGQDSYEKLYVAGERTVIDSSLNIGEDSELILSGRVAMTGDKRINNSGNVSIASKSRINLLGSLIQTSTGTTTFKQTSQTFVEGNIDNLGGSLIVDGELKANDVDNHGGFIDIKGNFTAAALKITLDGTAKKAGQVLVSEGAQFHTENLQLIAGLVDVKGQHSGERTWATIEDLNLSGGTLQVQGNSALIVGKGVGNIQFDKKNITSIAEEHNVKDKTILAVNSSLLLNKDSSIVIGTQSLKQPSANAVLGQDSVLIFNPENDKPVFVSEEKTSLQLDKDSKILVLDPFNPGYLTNKNVELSGQYEESEILSANRNVELTLVQKEDGWAFEKVSISEKNFIYPVIQNFLYNEYQNFTVNSENIGAQFFAKADNELYMSAELSNQLIAEVTQLAVLTGGKLTALNGAGISLKALNNELEESNLRQGEVKLYGGISGGASFSKHLNSYLNNVKFKAYNEEVIIGASYGISDSTGLSMNLVANRSTAKSSHAVTQGKNKQWNLGFNVGLRKDIGEFYVGSGFGFFHSSNKMSAMMPSSMMMEDVKSDPNFNFLRFSIEGGVNLNDYGQISFSPTIWHFPSSNQQIKIGNSNAFEMKNKSQTFVDLPLKVSAKTALGSVRGLDIDLNGDIDASIRAGQLKGKGDLKIAGLSPVERISLDRFNRWKAGASLAVKAQNKNFEMSAFISGNTGDVRFTGVGGIKASWKF